VTGLNVFPTRQTVGVAILFQAIQIAAVAGDRMFGQAAFKTQMVQEFFHELPLGFVHSLFAQAIIGHPRYDAID
jgi:small ligand-binding sensory domain FIST